MQFARIGSIAWSFRRELSASFGVMAVLVLLPIFATLGLLNNNSRAVSDAIISVNPVTHKVEVRGPSGKVIAVIDATTTWPMRGVITQEFGVPNLPYQKAHSGIDIDGGLGKPISAVMAGTVSHAGGNSESCGSHCVHVDHGHNITSVYAHMRSHFVKVGQKVKPGDALGEQGEEGWADGDHLHFEIRVGGIPVNPRSFLIGNPQPEVRE